MTVLDVAGSAFDLARCDSRATGISKAPQQVRSCRVVTVRSPPGNRLEKLKGDRAGQHSIRINDRWRICFRWQDGDAHEVELVDYH